MIDETFENTIAIRERIYEMLCHRFFTNGKERFFECRCIYNSNRDSLEFTVPSNMKVLRFSDLEEISEKPTDCAHYCQPLLSSFDLFDAFILDPTDNMCYGIQMKLRNKHSKTAESYRGFRSWLSKLDFKNLALIYVVPEYLERNFEPQKIPSRLCLLKSRIEEQYVLGLDFQY